MLCTLVASPVLGTGASVIGGTVVAMQGKNAAIADADALMTYADETAAIDVMGQAQKSLSITVSGYTRSFSASNFYDPVRRLLRQMEVQNDTACVDVPPSEHAKGQRALGDGAYARIFHTANFRQSTAPVLQSCGDHW
jgi:hypothetical protein